MKNMRHERGEQIASTTPILDSILSKFPAPALKVEVSVILEVVKRAEERLIKKLEDGNLTQMDIENELSSLPDVGGIEDGKVSMVDAVRFNCPQHDIKQLPVE